jgi:hypothetical protein
MSTTNLIIGLGLGVVLGALIIAFRHRFRDVFATLLVVGVVAVAVAVTIWRVDEYRDQKAATGGTVAESHAMPGVGVAPGPPPKPPVALPPPSIGRGATGGAAPPAVENPHAGGSK